MHKLTLLAASIAVVGFSAAASADTITPPEVYVGAQVGYQDTNLELSEDTSTAVDVSKSSTDSSISGVAGNVFVGAKFGLGNSVFIAPELNVGASDAEGITETSYNSGTIRRHDKTTFEAGTSLGVGLLAGVDITSSTSLYGRLGYQRTAYEASVSTSGNDFTSSSYAASDSESETFDGVRYGFGVSTDLSPDFSLRADWSQTRYSSKSFGSSDSKVSFEPTESLFQVGVAYTF